MTDSELNCIRFRWPPKPLWVVRDEDGDIDGFLRADTREEAERAAREEHGEEHGEECAVGRVPACGTRARTSPPCSPRWTACAPRRRPREATVADLLPLARRAAALEAAP